MYSMIFSVAKQGKNKNYACGVPIGHDTVHVALAYHVRDIFDNLKFRKTRFLSNS